MAREREQIADELCSITKLHRMRCLRAARSFGSCQEAEDFLTWVQRAAANGVDVTDEAAWNKLRKSFAARPQKRAFQQVMESVFMPNRGALMDGPKSKKYRRPTFNEWVVIDRLVALSRDSIAGKDPLGSYANALRTSLLETFPGCELHAVEGYPSVRVTVPAKSEDARPMRFYISF